MEALITSSDWMDYGIALLFGVVAITLILLFTDNGPKKFLSILAVIGTVGISWFFTGKKHKWSKEKLAKHNKQVDDFLATIKEREATIAQNNQEIADLNNQKKGLMASAQTDQKELDTLNKKIDQQLKDTQAMTKQIEEQKKVIQAASETIDSEGELPSIEDILKSSELKGEQK